MLDRDMIDSFERLLDRHCPPERVRQAEQEAWPEELWNAVEESGFLDILVPEGAGGAGLSLADAQPLMQALGYHAVPVPIAETMVARALLAAEGQSVAQGPISLVGAGGPLPLFSRREGDATLVDDGSALTCTNAGGSVQLSRPHEGLRPIMALILACMMAGAAERLLAMTVDYANQRVQFGKPIGWQQAVQQNLAVMAEKTIACRIAAQIGCGALPHPDLMAVATAKQVTGSAAVDVANIAHALHGAIGISEEYDLQLFTRRLNAWRLAEGGAAYWAKLLGAERLQQGGQPSSDFVRLSIGQC